MSVDVVVVGSINHDVTALTPHLPRPGETVLGRGHYTGPGGKGANQAVAAARLGASTVLIGRVGADQQGAALLERLEAENVDTTRVGVDEDLPTGLAVITVDDNAENTIVVSPGANQSLTPAHLTSNEDVLGSAKVVLAQLEVPTETVVASAQSSRGMFLLNPAPARHLSASLLEAVDVLTPNRTELGTLAGTETPHTADDAAEAARRIEGPGAFVVTLGAEGALVIDGEDVTQIASIAVSALDPTGAGDAFCGMLAVELARGRRLVEATERAVVAGALATTRPGAIDAMPTIEDVEGALGS